MNIVKLQDMLRGVPDDALIGYVQNPQGEVPSFLALSELQRRKDTRAKYQAEQTPESSVAEDLTRPAQPQGGLAMLAGQPQNAPNSQGIANLPIDEGMYQEQNFAGGGIVAFDDGGEVKRFVNQGFVSLDPRPRYGAPEKPGFMQRFFGSSSQDLLEQERQRLLNKIKDPRNPYNDLDYQQLQEVEAKLSGKVKPGGAMSVQEGQAMQKKYEQELAKPKDNTPPPPPPREDRPIQEKPVDPYSVGMGFKPRPENDAEEKMARFDKLYGEDPAKKRLTDRLAKMEERATREEALSPWMALTEAGFNMMSGTSPFALANVGQGAAAGVRSYRESQDRLSRLEEKRMDIDTRLAEAERAKKLAAVQYGVNSEEYAKKANDEYRLKEMQSRYEVKKYEELNPYKMYGQVAEIQAKREEARAKALKEPEYRTASLYASKTITSDTPKEEAQKIKDAQIKMKELERKLDTRFPVPTLPSQAGVPGTNPTLKYDPALRKVMPI